MSNLDKWNRKDASAENTISKIMNILDELNIPVEITESCNYKNLWYSNRMEIVGLPSIGTNGKGISEQYAMASCLGEFMERLQSSILLGYLFPQDSGDSLEVCRYDKKEFEKYFEHVCKYLTKDEQDELLLLKYKNILYHDIFTKKVIHMPESLINILCGSNGLAAGNSFEEAYVQGISEICERYVIQYIYTEKYDDMFSTIRKSVLEKMESYNLIRAIEEKKFHVYIIDCTLKGILPVIGVLVFDPSYSKYFFKLGSDPDLDIALQRCITEIFQGVSFDINFRMHMNEYLTCERDDEGFWFSESRLINHTKAEVDGTGNIPRAFFKCLIKEVDEINGFSKEKLTNVTAAKFMTGKIKKIGKNIAIKNYTQAGFPCVRILVSDMCQSFYYQGANLLNVVKAIQKIKKLFRSNDFNYEEVLECMYTILEYPAYVYDFNMAKLLGVVITDWMAYPYLHDPYLFTAYLSLHLRKYDAAINYLEISNKNSRKNTILAKLDLIVIKAMKENVTKEELLEYISEVDENHAMNSEIDLLYKIREDGIFVPKCFECSSCLFKANCCYKLYEKINTSISFADETLDEKFNKFIELIS